MNLSTNIVDHDLSTPTGVLAYAYALVHYAAIAAMARTIHISNDDELSNIVLIADAIVSCQNVGMSRMQRESVGSWLERLRRALTSNI